MNPHAAQALQLRDIHLPGAPAFWPPAPGWWLLGTLLLALLAWAGIAALKRHRIRQERQLVRDALARIEAGLAQDDGAAAFADLSVLLRRHALSRYPRAQVAGLTGRAWLQFLDQAGGASGFADGPGRVLATAPYQRVAPADLDPTALLALVGQWLEHEGPRPQSALRKAYRRLRGSELTP
ncbi:MAG: DUF4381 domain-containing protein [Burkholderiaceae bacterium]